jgi:hypothetical protein
LSHSSSSIFVMGFFEIGSQELFGQAGFEPRSSNLSLLSSWDCRRQPLCLVKEEYFLPPFVYLYQCGIHDYMDSCVIHGVIICCCHFFFFATSIVPSAAAGPPLSWPPFLLIHPHHSLHLSLLSDAKRYFRLFVLSLPQSWNHFSREPWFFQ